MAGRVLEGFWLEYHGEGGLYPCSREGAGMVAIGEKVVMMFGNQH